MNPRERILAITVLTVVILAVGGFLFKWLFLDAINRVYADIATAKADIAKKEDDQLKEENDENALLRDDPPLAQWKQRSLPEDKNLAEEVKSGRSVDEANKRHEDMLQVDYQRFLSDLVIKSGFSPSTIKVSSAPADRKGGPIISGKTPAYTRMTFTVQAQGRLDSVERMLADFYQTPLLHQIRNLTLTARPPARVPGPGGLPGGGALRFPGAPGAVPGIPGAPAGIPGLPGGAQTSTASGDLDVSMTVEALLVTGAQKRDELLPKTSDLSPIHILAYDDSKTNDVERQYDDMLAKNMFTGIAAASKLSEDRDSVLAAVRLTTIWTSGRRWQASIYDQGKGGDEMRLKPPVLDEFSIVDSYSNVLVRGKVVKLDQDGMIFQADGKYYRWQVGQYLGRRLASAKPTATPTANPFGGGDDAAPQYIAGVMDTPLKPDELKALGVGESSSSSEK